MAELVAIITGILGVIFTGYAFLFGGKGILEKSREDKKRLLLSDTVNKVNESEQPQTSIANYLPKIDCIGRKTVINQIIQSVEEKNSLTVVSGNSGSGKTTIALAAGNELLEMSKKSPNPKIKAFTWIDARYNDLTLDDFLNRLGMQLEASEISTESGEAKTIAARRVLSKIPTLIILDNLDSLDDTEKEKKENSNNILEFLNTLPEGSYSIVTTRYLSVRKGNIMKINNFNLDESKEFIRTQAKYKKLEVLIDASDEKLELFHKYTDGSPLAIEWIVGQVYGGRSIDDVLNKIKGGKSDVFEILFRDTWDLLDKVEKEILIDLTVARTSFNGATISKISNHSEVSTDNAVSRLVKLMFVDVSQSIEKQNVRYSLHPLTHLFITRHSEDFPGEIERAHESATEYFIKFVESQGENAKVIEPEIENILYLISWCKTRSKWKLIMRLMDVLYDILLSLGYFEERAELGLLSAEGAEKSGVPERKAHYLNLACIYPLIGKYVIAKEILLKALDAATQQNDGLEIAVVKKSLAYNYYRQGDVKSAYDELRGVDLLVQQYEEPNSVPNNYVDILALQGAIEFYLGMYDEAMKTQEKMIKKSTEIGWQRALCYGLRDIAEIQMIKKDYVNARVNLEQAFTIAEKYSDKRQSARIQISIAKLLFRTGFSKLAKQRIKQALVIFDKLGMINETKESNAFLNYISSKPDIYWKLVSSFFKHLPVYAPEYPIGGD